MQTRFSRLDIIRDSDFYKWTYQFTRLSDSIGEVA